MIFESHPWRMELMKHRKALENWSDRAHTSRGYFAIEKAVFQSAFVMRKLMENRKVTDGVRKTELKCKSYKPFRPLSDRVTKHLGAFRIDKEYDFSNSDSDVLSSYDLASEIMHSYIFRPSMNRLGKMTGFFINSYRHRDKRLLLVNAGQYAKVIQAVETSHVTSARVWVDPATGRIKSEHK